MGSGTRCILSEQGDASLSLTDVAQQGADQRALAHAIAAQQANSLAPADSEVDAVQHMAGAVPRVQGAGIHDRFARRGPKGSSLRRCARGAHS